MTYQDGDRFWKLPECYVRGNSIKYLRIPDEVVTMVSEEDQRDRKSYCASSLCFRRYDSLAVLLGRMQGRGRGGRTAGKMGRGGSRGGDSSGRGGRGGYDGGRGGRGRGRGGYDGGRGGRGGRT